MPDSTTTTSSLVRADMFMISGCQDAQTSADVSNVGSFQLPDPAGKSGGACTSALLKVLYANTNKEMTFVDVLMNMRHILNEGNYTQIPQLTSSMPLNVDQPFYIVPPSCDGTRRAVLIGINYVGQQGELSGCHNDILNMREYLIDEEKFRPENITVLMDDGNHELPTYANILAAYVSLVKLSSSGDAVYCHYSGHGGKIRDQDGDESDGYDETLVPVDYSSAGQIRDDTLYKTLVGPMAKGVTLTSTMDCCHSGTVLDLPYKFKADGTSFAMSYDNGFNAGRIEQYNSDLGLGSTWCAWLSTQRGLVIFIVIVAILVVGLLLWWGQIE